VHGHQGFDGSIRPARPSAWIYFEPDPHAFARDIAPAGHGPGAQPKTPRLLRIGAPQLELLSEHLS
jgi:hypothetical protein